MQRPLSLFTGNWSLVTGNWSLVTGHWQLVTGNWHLVTAHWPLMIISGASLGPESCKLIGGGMDRRLELPFDHDARQLFRP